MGLLDDVFTYDRLAQRWDRTVGSLYVMKAHGELAKPDLIVGQAPLWARETVLDMEKKNPNINRRQARARRERAAKEREEAKQREREKETATK